MNDEDQDIVTPMMQLQRAARLVAEQYADEFAEIRERFRDQENAQREWVAYTLDQRDKIRERFKQLRAQHKKEVEDLKKQISTLRSKSRVRLAPGELR